MIVSNQLNNPPSFFNKWPFFEKNTYSNKGEGQKSQAKKNG
jgi:hypothetical protein